MAVLLVSQLDDQQRLFTTHAATINRRETWNKRPSKRVGKRPKHCHVNRLSAVQVQKATAVVQHLHLGLPDAAYNIFCEEAASSSKDVVEADDLREQPSGKAPGPRPSFNDLLQAALHKHTALKESKALASALAEWVVVEDTEPSALPAAVEAELPASGAAPLAASAAHSTGQTSTRQRRLVPACVQQ